MNNKKIKFVILDDDPTGIQTIHGCLLLTCWNPVALEKAFRDNLPFFYILTNSRAYAPPKVKKIIAQITKNILTVNQFFDYRIAFISRSDSTLRGHFPLEINTILQYWEPNFHLKIDAIFMIPAFFEGNRITYNNTHFIRSNTGDIPTHQTEFAKDSIFGYASSYLPTYIEDKTKRHIKAGQIRYISISMLKPERKKNLSAFLANLQNRQMVIVNATNYEQLNSFSEAVLAMMKMGKNFLFQSAASLVKSLTKNPDQPLLSHQMISKKGPGLFIIGSYVNQTTQQLQMLLDNTSVFPLEISVNKIMIQKNYQDYLLIIRQKIIQTMQANKTPVVFTTRKEIFPSSKKERILLGQKISIFLSELVKKLPVQPSYLVAKGGITSHQILSEGLQVKESRVLGQILPGIPVISLPHTHQYSNLPFIIFPGNVGDKNALVDIFRKLNI